MESLDHGAALMAGLALGLSSAGLCFWSCAAVMGPFLVATADDPGQKPRWSSVPQLLRALGWYNIGRLLAYGIAALVVSQLATLQAGSSRELQALLRAIAAGVVGWAMIRPASTKACWASRGRAAGSFLLGVAQGFAPCPPFLAAVGLGLASRPTAALLLFGALFAVTTLFTLPLALLEPLRRRPALRWAMRGMGALVCLYLGLSALALLLDG